MKSNAYQPVNIVAAATSDAGDTASAAYAIVVVIGKGERAVSEIFMRMVLIINQLPYKNGWGRDHLLNQHLHFCRGHKAELLLWVKDRTAVRKKF